MRMHSFQMTLAGLGLPLPFILLLQLSLKRYFNLLLIGIPRYHWAGKKEQLEAVIPRGGAMPCRFPLAKLCAISQQAAEGNVKQ